ncbi:DUF2849 domain-containing protein [Pararhizobium mangrovi]|uniref:DUF2849 domain-containing protein n=1 Tax=Pararhizobium mangrovi TaxID=2590452 RepID=A0A506UEX2_9HYPH|nr:DUF2849 domain-containing protein [Pararhizobium mangrovi]TPW31339.1 DUF2849 domain-containing protein [Pararhizobium mangrovi]
MVSKVVTANRLSDGLAVWLGASGRWSERIDEAFVARHDDAVRSLEACAKQALGDNKVVEVNVVDVVEEGIHLRPARLRERIRADGPTIPYGRDARVTHRVAG